MIKVLHSCKVFLPVSGGVQRIVSNITEALRSFEHTIITTGEDGCITHEKLGSTTIRRSRSYLTLASMPIAPSLPLQLIRAARNADVIAVHYPFPLAELATLCMPWRRPIVVHWHSEVVAQKRLRWLVAPITLLLLWRARAIIATSDHMLQHSWLLQRVHQKVHFIPYGAKAARRTNFKAIEHFSADIPNQPFVLVGRHVSYKGIKLAIAAMRRVDARLHIYGDGPLFEQHKYLVTEMGLERKVKLFPHASDRTIEKSLASCCALLVPSVTANEAFAIVQLEAMRYGKPIINTALHSSVPWVARHNKEAITVRPNDEDELALAMQKLLSSPQLRQRLGSAGYKRFQQTFSMEEFATRLTKVYQHAINN